MNIVFSIPYMIISSILQTIKEYPLEYLFFIICIAGIIIQIVSIVKMKQLGKSKYWNIFIGINIGYFISTSLTFGNYFKNSLDLGEELLVIFIFGALFIVNFILFIVGVIIKTSIKTGSVKLSKNSAIIALVVVLLGILTAITIPAQGTMSREQLISNDMLTYLTNKYGDDDFKIIQFEKDFSYNGIINAEHTGYEATVTSSLLKDNFITRVYGTKPGKTKISTDEFIEHYYNEKIFEYLSSKYDVEVSVWIDEEKIPDSLGHIPTINELVDFDAIDNIFIKPKPFTKYSKDNDVDETLNYLKELSVDLINYFNISNDFKFWFGNYNIKISGNSISIEHVNDKTYELNISDIKAE